MIQLPQYRFNSSLTNIAALIFALLAAMSVRYEWTDRYRSRFSVEPYHSETVLAWCMLGVAAICAARALWTIDRRVYGVGVTALTATSTVAALWVLLLIVGDGDPDTYGGNFRSPIPLGLAHGLIMALVSLGGVVVMVALHLGLRPSNDPILATAPYRARLIVVLSILAATGVLMPWTRGAEVLEPGTSFGRGALLLTLACLLLLLAAVRSHDETDDVTFRRGALALGMLMVLTTSWFFIDVVGSADPSYDNLLISSWDAQRLSGGMGLYVSLYSSFAIVATVVWPRSTPAWPSQLPRPIISSR